MHRKHISSGSEFEQRIGYSRAVVEGQWIFVSGTTGFDYKNMTIAKDAGMQTEQCFANIAAALAEAGSGLDDVVRVNYIFPKRSDFEKCIPVIKKHLGHARPAATMLVADLVDERMKVEITVTACKGL